MKFKSLLGSMVFTAGSFLALSAQNEGGESQIFRAAPCDQSYFNLDLSELQFKSSDKKAAKAGGTPFLYLKLTQGEREFTRIFNSNEFDIDKQGVIKTKHNVPAWGPFPYTGEPLQLDIKLYSYSSNTLDLVFKLVDDVTLPDANQWVASHHISDLLEEPLESVIEQSILKGETKMLSAFSHTWMRESSFTSFLDFSIAREGFFLVKPVTAHKEHADEQRRYQSYASVEAIPGDEKGDTWLVIGLKQFEQRPDIRSFEDYYREFSQAEKAAHEKDAERMEYYFDRALHFIYANDNFTNEDKAQYHYDEYKYLLEIIKTYIPNYSGRTLPEPPCVTK